ncbi:MAG: hypothetical protein H7263_19015 [Candidatus Sericytochromatia bacterium]|nr:hypothetical protein [Candidatus Sericytochromatia bacterium]
MDKRQQEEFEKIKQLIVSKNAKLISQNYKNNYQKLEIQDNKGRFFFITNKNLKKGKWSPYESKLSYCPQYHLNIVQQIALKKNGKLISTKYEGNNKDMEFEDAEGNRFFKPAKLVKMGIWSPFEISNLSEEICRQCFEFIFKEKFPSNWKIVKRFKKRPLQLDGYSDKLNFAFEYQGEQHYEENLANFNYYWSKDDFYKLKIRDEEKKIYCQHSGIFLFEIKYFAKRYKNDIEYLNHVLQEIKKFKHEGFKNIEEKLDLNSFKINRLKMKKSEFYLNQLRTIAHKKGGKLISKEYRGCKDKLEFEDKFGNRFFSSPNNVRHRWSPFESKRVRDPAYHLKELEFIAKKQGGKLISNQYINNRTKLEFQDKFGNNFFMTPDSVKQGSWSNYRQFQITDSEYNLKIISQIAKSKGCKLISTEYIDNKTKLEFEDKDSNKFFASPYQIKNRKKIGFEVINNDYHLNVIKRIAEDKGGKLISNKYINNSTKLEFEDSKRRRFFKTPLQIKSNDWSIFEKKENKRNIHYNILKKIAEDKGGKLISTEYINNNTKLEFEDDRKNRFMSSPDKIKNGVWSPYISGNVGNSEYHLKILRKIAKERKGKLISNEYINNSTKLEFEDSKGNRFFISPCKIKIGQWSKKDIKKDTYTDSKYHLKILCKIAEKRGGKLISINYINNRHKMEFEDEKGFRFYRTPLDIKRGRWNNFAK